jgi:hypothetical protein
MRTLEDLPYESIGAALGLSAVAARSKCIARGWR